MDSSFTKVPLNVPKLSGFDKSHQNLLTSKCGTITPILIDELIPGSRIDLQLALNAQLPPLASDTFMRCSIKTEAFFIPFRLLASSFESWFTDTPQQFMLSVPVAPQSFPQFSEQLGWLPCFGNWSDASESATLSAAFSDPGSLGDYLGLKFPSTSPASPTIPAMSALPFLAYWRVIDDWYRNTLVERPVFCRPVSSTSAGSGPTINSAPGSYQLCAGTAPYYFFTQDLRHVTSGSPNSRQNYCFDSQATLQLANGKKLYELAQRNFDLDYFTTALPDKQLGQQQSVSFNTSGSTGSFTIEALRMSNSLQQFQERNQLSGVRYQDTLYQRYGANLSSGVAQRALFLGSDEYVIYSKGIYQNSQNNVSGSSSNLGSTANTGNPFGTVAAKYGSASATGSGLHIRFEANEPGYLMVMATLVPHVTYSSGVHRRFMQYNRAGSITDMANPILQNMGPQPIFQYELDGSVNSSNIFGYTDHYASFKTMEDELHGEMRDGQSLEAFALQRGFAPGSTPQINSSFLKIPTNFMDQVTAVGSALSTYGYWLDTYFNYRVAQPLAKYSLPTLQDPAYEHGKTIVVNKGGSKL